MTVVDTIPDEPSWAFVTVDLACVVLHCPNRATRSLRWASDFNGVIMTIEPNDWRVSFCEYHFDHWGDNPLDNGDETCDS